MDYSDIYGRYLSLQRDENYQLQYGLFKKVEKIHLDWFNVFYTVEPKAEEACKILFDKICQKWELTYPVNPNLKVNSVSFVNNEKPSKAVKEILAAFGIKDEMDLVFPPLEEENTWIYKCLYPSGRKKKVKASTRQLERIKQYQKFMCHSLIVTMKASAREVGYMLNLSKDTVINWAEEMKNVPEPERMAIVNELKTGRKFSSRDVYDAHESKRRTLEQYEQEMGQEYSE